MNIPGYRIEHELGHGGMATVYLAVQESLGRHVALKVMAAALAADRTFSERFIREARTVAQLNHPNIVAIHDVGVVEFHHYLSLEYISGGDLKGRIKQGAISPEEALGIARQIASGLGYAHGKGIVHRDVKPENILFREDGTAVLTDFGIAKAGGGTRMTGMGMSVGTPRYMSPEQARGKSVDSRSDLYALGVVLYEMLTGDVPYKAEESIAVGIMHVSEPIPELPEALSLYQSLINAVMAKVVDERIQTAQDFIFAIDALSTGKPFASDQLSISPSQTKTDMHVDQQNIVLPSEKDDRRGMLKWGLGGALLAALLVIGAYQLEGLNHPVGFSAIDEGVVVGSGGSVSMQAAAKLAEAKQRADRKAAAKLTEAKQRADKKAAAKLAEAKQRADKKAAEKLAEAKQRADRKAAAELAEAKQRADEKAAAELAEAKQRANKKAAAELAERKKTANLGEAVKLAEAKQAADIRALLKRSEPKQENLSPGKQLKATLIGQFVLIPAGQFTMGNKWDKKASPEHRVKIDSFILGKYEVTQGLWKSVMGSKLKDWLPSPQYPVTEVSYNTLMRFITKLNAITHLHFRLPSEAEWEYAARAGAITKFAWGSKKKNANEYVWWTSGSGLGQVLQSGMSMVKKFSIKQASRDHIHKVGLKKSNAFGLYDMFGNVLEWPEGCWQRDYKHAPSNGSPSRSGNCGSRSLRGGSSASTSVFDFLPYKRFKNDVKDSTTMFIKGGLPTVHLNGFRLALDLNAESKKLVDLKSSLTGAYF